VRKERWFIANDASEKGLEMPEAPITCVVERFCRCDGKYHVKKDCHKWKAVQNASKAHAKAFQMLLDYLNKYNPEIWSGDVVTLDYAKYRVRMIDNGK
jgi:hypothetical protein